MEARPVPGNRKKEHVRKVLFENAMQGKWKAVVNMYRRWPWLAKEKINRGGNTALHMAVSDRQERFVEQLVEVILLRSGMPEVVLQIKNKKGNTPLHLAASLGNVSMCKCIPSQRPGLVGVLNDEGETPLFLAARHGKMDAFFCLLSSDTEKYVDTRNKKGETVLHCAINRGHFKLASLILEQHPNVFNTFTEKGATPLHVLANKPGAFRSGTYLSLLDKLIYHCVLVHTSPNWFTALQNKICRTASTRNLKKFQYTYEEENPPQLMTEILEVEEESSIIPNEARKDESRNYNTCLGFIRGILSLLNKAMRSILFFLGMGLSYIHKIKKKKETNIWSIKVMDQLLNLEGTQICDYDRAGWNPLYCQRTTANYNTDSEEENKPEQDEETGLPNYEDLSATDSGVLGKNHGKQGKGDEGILTKEGSSQKERDEGTFEENQKRNRSSEEDSNWALLLRLGKAGLRADPIIVAGKAAKKLDDELCMETEEKNDEMGRVETPILLAAKNGITEMVKEILEIYPLAIHDTDLEEKNVVLLAVENRHHHVYELLLKTNILKDTVFGAVDRNGNSALHLAAMVPDNRPWLIPGAALQMQWEVLWYEYVKRSMPPHFFPSHNKFNETAKQIFTRDHKDMVQKGKEWLGSTATSCSVVATLIATVGFATSSAVPGGTREGSGKPNLEQQPAFHIFAVSSLIALCFSVTSTVMFLAILTSRHQESDFGQDLPIKLLIGLTSLFISILSILVTFCAGHFFLLKDELSVAALPVYAVTCLPATFFALAQLPLYIDLIWATFRKVPQRWKEEAD
ncbi:uncharacterized protein LOC117917860 isoform X2 [Vitis riparia]|uniref:uncharacterized protein LOC117917860 isoform X2 n=1 Tax=Vitis riparia TaxID=96939 RepID=UPI00155A3507|nr:uncharacterized protein LOC117917860 isoform X2 [Vitis riparia]